MTFLNLLLGAVVTVYIFMLHRTRPHGKVYLSLCFYSLLYNLLLTGALITKYIGINLPPLIDITSSPQYQNFAQAAFALIMGGLFLFQSIILRSFTRGARSSGLPRFSILFISLGGGCLLLGVIGQFLGLGLAYWLTESAGDLFFLGEAAILVILLIISQRNLRGREKKELLSYSILFLLRYPAIILLFVLPKELRLAPSLALLFYMNLSPLLWVIFFSRPHQRGEELPSRLTEREKDIVRLVLQGLTNRDIQEKLFISSHTVKNHLYHIYQKLEVKNRYELISQYKETAALKR